MLNYSLNYIAGLFVSGRISQQVYLKLILNYIFSKSKDGGEGSGNFGHSGIPGQIDGSQTTNSITVSDDDISRYLADNNITKGILSKDYSLSVSELKQRVEQRNKKGWWGFKNKEEFDKAKDIKSDIDNKLQSPVINDADKEALQQESDKINRQINRYNLVNDIFNKLSQEQSSQQKQSEEKQGEEKQSEKINNEEKQSESSELNNNQIEQIFDDILKSRTIYETANSKNCIEKLQDINVVISQPTFNKINNIYTEGISGIVKGEQLLPNIIDNKNEYINNFIRHLQSSQLHYRNTLFMNIRDYLKNQTEENLLKLFTTSETLKLSCDEIDNFNKLLNKDNLINLASPKLIKDKQLFNEYKNDGSDKIDNRIDRIRKQSSLYNFRDYTKLVDVLADKANKTNDVLEDLRIENNNLINTSNFPLVPYGDIKLKGEGNIEPAKELAKKYHIKTNDIEKLYNPDTPAASLTKKNNGPNVIDSIIDYTRSFINRPDGKMKEVIDKIIDNSPIIENDLYRAIKADDDWSKMLLNTPDNSVVRKGSNFRSYTTLYDNIAHWSDTIIKLKGDKHGIFVASCSDFLDQSEVIVTTEYKKLRTIETDNGKKIIELEAIPERKKSTDSIPNIIENNIKSKILKNKQEFILDIIDNLLKVNNNINKYISNITYNGYHKNDVFNELKKQLMNINNKINILIELKNNEKKLYDSINNQFIPNIKLSKRMKGVDSE